MKILRKWTTREIFSKIILREQVKKISFTFTTRTVVTTYIEKHYKTRFVLPNEYETCFVKTAGKTFVFTCCHGLLYSNLFRSKSDTGIMLVFDHEFTLEESNKLLDSSYFTGVLEELRIEYGTRFDPEFKEKEQKKERAAIENDLRLKREIEATVNNIFKPFEDEIERLKA